MPASRLSGPIITLMLILLETLPESLYLRTLLEHIQEIGQPRQIGLCALSGVNLMLSKLIPAEVV